MLCLVNVGNDPSTLDTFVHKRLEHIQSETDWVEYVLMNHYLLSKRALFSKVSRTWETTVVISFAHELKLSERKEAMLFGESKIL